MPQARVASSHYEPDSQGDGRKIVLNYYAEPNPQDPERPVRLVTTPGATDLDTGNTITGTIRGIAQADGHAGGKLLIVDGTTVRTYDPSGPTFGTLTGALAGTDRVQAAFSETQGAFLANGDLYVSTGTAVAAASDGDWATLLSNHSVSAFTSVASLGQRLIATYGTRFGYSDVLDFDNTTTLSFYTAESSPDDLVACKVLGRTLYLFGTQTIEAWVETGDTDDPFQPIVTDAIPRGCMARDTIVELDNTLIFIGNDRNVHRLTGQGTQILNKNDTWVTQFLEDEDAGDVICSGYEAQGHAFYVINGANGCIVYDIPTQSWHRRQTYLKDGWDWAYLKKVDATLYAGQRGGSGFVSLDRDTATDLGESIVREFTAHLPVMRGRPAVSSVRLDGQKGVGLTSGQGSNPQVTLYVSKDRGLTFGPGRTRSIGAKGEYDRRTIWRRNGRAQPEQTVFRFRVSDPVRHYVAGVAINED